MNMPSVPMASALTVPGELSRLLIVEDDERMRRSLCLLLESPGCEISTAASGAEALLRLQEERFDLVLLDVGLPDMSGLDLLARLAAQSPDGPAAIMVSGERDIEAAVRALRHGALDFVRKPEDMAMLPRRVDQVLRQRRLEREHTALSARLAESERLHRLLVERSPDLIYTLDAQGFFVFLNPRVETLLGYARQELLGHHYSRIVHEDDWGPARHAMSERRSDARASTNVELRLLGKPGVQPGTAPRQIVVTVSAMGIYAEAAAPGSLRAQRSFVGSYGVIRDITERKRAEETITFQALHDQLTDLPNRRLFENHLALALVQAERRGQMVGVVFMDLDRFKVINDTYGHRSGDELLQGVAARLRASVRAGDTVARLGGDEFIVLLPDLAAPGDAQAVAEKILASLERPFLIDGREHGATVSLGIATYPRDGLTAEQLIQNADIAMYEVKSHGRNGSCMFTSEMNLGHLQRRNLESDLRKAVDAGAFEPHFQPLVSLGRGRVVGAELLLRWRHPVLGMLMPGTFMPLAESSGLASRIGDWTLDRACAQLAHWRELGHGDVRVAVNLSPLEVSRPELVDRVRAAMERHQVDRGLLELEITENLVLETQPGVVASLQTLQDLGVRVVIDDFGTRYSLLSYLQQFPVSGLKIDKCFVQELRPGGNPTVVEAILGIARGYRLHLVAEGVENEVQLQMLRQLGCDEVQGFLLGKPTTAELLTAQLARRDLWPVGGTPDTDLQPSATEAC